MIIDSVTLNLIGAGVGFVLTLCVFSYLIGDNPLYRAAVHFFIGTAAGYAVVIAVSNVLWPQVIRPLVEMLPPPWGTAAPWPAWPTLTGIGLVILLLLKLVKPLRFMGSMATAFMVGVGAAVAIGGAITGTLVPMTEASFQPLWPATSGGDWSHQLGAAINAALILVGTVFTLGYFYYGARLRSDGIVERPLPVRVVAIVGQVFLGTALGVMYAGAIVASLAVCVERAGSLIIIIEQLATRLSGLY